MLERFRQNHQEQNAPAGGWDALAAQANAGGFNAEAAMAEREKANHENQTNKIVQILRTGDYQILGQREPVTATNFEKDAVIDQIADGTIGYDQEEKLLSMIAAPSDRKGINGVAQDVI